MQVMAEMGTQTQDFDLTGDTITWMNKYQFKNRLDSVTNNPGTTGTCTIYY